jgi:perosamine synthetase
MSRKIYLDAPSLGVLEKKYLNRAIDSGYVSTAGPFVVDFENQFTTYLGVKKAVSVQSGTAALHIALYELGIKEGDEVIVPALTFIATINPVIYMRAKPVFVDVDIATWNIDPVEIEKKITNKTKAIIPVHLYGNPCNMQQIMAIARKHKLFVIEDATESLGSRYKGRLTGTIGHLGCFSFNGNKTITTGGGGMVASDNKKHIEHIKFLVNQARDEGKGYYHPEMGFNYRMTNIEAALGMAQMGRLGSFLKKKKEFNLVYKDYLSNNKKISFQQEYAGAQSSYWLTCVTFRDGVDIDCLQKKLKQKNIPVRRVFMPVTEFPHCKKYRNAKPGNAYQIYENSLCLPGSILNSIEDIEYICRIINTIINKG